MPASRTAPLLGRDPEDDPRHVHRERLDPVDRQAQPLVHGSLTDEVDRQAQESRQPVLLLGLDPGGGERDDELDGPVERPL